MESGYFFHYAEGNLVCIAILAIMLANDLRHSNLQEKQLCFNKTLVSFILYFLNDIGWAAVLGGQLPRYRFLIILFNLLNFILLSLMAYEWFMYMAASENMEFRKDPKMRNLCRLPIILSTLALGISYAAAPSFWISGEGELNSLYYPMLIITPIIYILASFILSMMNAGKTEIREEKSLYRLIGIYPVSIAVSGIIQTFALDAPLFCFGCTIMMVHFYIQNMETMVSVDPLTRLNNRGQINRYMDQYRYRENIRTYIMMIDVNRFKEINDTYGHAEGDRALILVSEALKKSIERIKAPVFLGRYGGDEFTMFIQTTEGDAHMERAAEAIRDALRAKRQENELPYELKVSIGYEALRDKDDTMKDCLVRADERLYLNKRSGRKE